MNFIFDLLALHCNLLVALLEHFEKSNDHIKTRFFFKTRVVTNWSVMLTIDHLFYGLNCKFLAGGAGNGNGNGNVGNNNGNNNGVNATIAGAGSGNGNGNFGNNNGKFSPQ